MIRSLSVGLFFLVALPNATTAAPENQSTVLECHTDSECLNLAERAAAASKRGEFGEARLLYQLAYKKRPDPRLLFNIARLFHKQGQTLEATEYYEKFLYAPISDSQQRQQALEYLLQIRARQTTISPIISSGSPAYRAGPRHGRPGTTLLVTGSIFLALGGISLGTGIGLFTIANNTAASLSGAGLTANGVVSILIGVPLLVIGRDRNR